MQNQPRAKPSRTQQAFRTAFDFLVERLRTLGKVGNTHAFWEATGEILLFRSAHMDNDPLLMGLLTACMEELERVAKGDAA